MMKITGLSHLFKWENLHNWWLTKYFFAPLYTAHILCKQRPAIKRLAAPVIIIAIITIVLAIIILSHSISSMYLSAKTY